MKDKKGMYVIGIVSKMLDLHPQTIRMYEKLGFIRPERSEGQTRMYSDEDLSKLEEILYYTKTLGVNKAGLEIILQIKDYVISLEKHIDSLQKQISDMGNVDDNNKDSNTNLNKVIKIKVTKEY